MADLSHWDFAENFCGYDAAALMLGLEPRESENEQWRIGVITGRMETNYKNAHERYFYEAVGLPDEGQDIHAGRPLELASERMNHLHRRCWLYGEETPFTDWLTDKRQSRFDHQEFSRNEIVRWLGAIGMQSVYSFSRASSPKEPAKLTKWPWGDHHTTALGHLEAAAKRYWSSYDPADPTTANTNATVSEWLQGERKVSKTMADSIASMLRPDGLPPGPRK